MGLMQAVVNISDEGVRLRPLSCIKNGAMLDVGNMTIAEHIVKLLASCAVTKVTFICGYMSNDIKRYMEKANNFGAAIKYVSTASEDDALSECAKKINEDFIYISKPVYADFDMSDAIAFHKKRRSFLTVLTPRGMHEGFVSDKTGRVTRVEEKQLWSSISGEQSPGIYILNCHATKYIIKGDFSRNALGEIVRSGKVVYTKAIDGVCESIYDTASYMRSCALFLEGMKKTSCAGICVAEGAEVEKGAILEAPCYVGSGAHIHKGAKIGAFSQIGEGCVVSEGASIKRSIISKDCRIGASATLRGCIFDENVHCGRGVTVYEQAVIGKASVIGAEVLVKSFVKIWPEKTIEKGAVVAENIMWGQKKRSKLFENGRIKGVVNVDITPLFCTLLGSVAGRVFNMGEVGISTDDSASGAMLRDAIAAGLMGCGCRVKDFGEQPLPITRRGTAFYALQGAVAVSVNSSSGEDVAEITILGKNGFDVDTTTEQSMEELFEKGEVVYPEARSIAEVEYVFEFKLHYLKSLVGYTKAPRLPMRVLLCCNAPWGRRLIVSALADFSSQVSIFEGRSESEEDLKMFASATEKGNFDVGFMLDNRCEKLYIAHGGKILGTDTYDVLCALIVMKKYKNAKIYVPVTTSSAVDVLAEKHNCSVVRTKTTPPAIMKKMSGSEKYVSEQFIFRFDAVGSVILLMDYLTKEKLSLETVVAEIPPIATSSVVMECKDGNFTNLLEKIYDMPTSSDMPEGVKITFDKGWVIVIPDMEKEVFRMVSDATSVEAARELCDICIKQIKEN
ncbi:MAG: hypothetical protein IJ435_02755 [Clostridia bacterium]|nr:hypothetical protein [Clostridia bacterium]